MGIISLGLTGSSTVWVEINRKYEIILRIMKKVRKMDSLEQGEAAW